METNKGLLSETVACCTVMYLAAQHGHKDIVEYVSELPVAAKKDDLIKFTALYFAAINGNLDIIKYLNMNDVKFTSDEEDFEQISDSGTDMEDNNENFAVKTPDFYTDLKDDTIFDAAKKGNQRALKQFLDGGVHIDTYDENHNTALHLAVNYGNVNAAKFLVENGAKVNCKNVDIDTPLHLAAKCGSLKIVRILLNKGIYTEIKNYCLGNTALHIACENGYDKIVKLLLEKGANINAKNKEGKEAIDKTVNENVILLLLENGLLDQIDLRRTSLLHIAAIYNFIALTEYLIQKNVYIDIYNKAKETPLFLSAANGHCGVMKVLIKNGANINKKTKSSLPFLTSVKTNSTEFTPLHIAAYNGHYDAVEMLLEYEVDVDSLCKFDLTALMMAARNGHTEIVKLLLLYRADKDLMSYLENKTALQYAECNHHQEIVNILTQHKFYSVFYYNKYKK